jgi:hypothetical protein
MPALASIRTSMTARGLRPVQDLAAGRPHGDRLRYMAGCRCFDCRRSNTAYEASRKLARAAGDWNGMVPAVKARAHLQQLSAIGVGRRSVAAVSNLSGTILAEINAGRRVNIRARTERAILAVTAAAAADHARVDATATWEMLDALIADGHTRGSLALRLGSNTPILQLRKDFVTVRSAYLVERMYDQLKSTCAKKTLATLKKLRDEGYTPGQIEARMAALSRSLGEQPPPTLEPLNGRIAARTAALVTNLYIELTK